MKQLFLFLSLFGLQLMVSAQEQITDFELDIKDYNRISYLGQFDNKTVFFSSGSKHYLFFYSEKGEIDSMKLNFEASNLFVTISSNMLWVIPEVRGQNEVKIYTLQSIETGFLEYGVLYHDDIQIWSRDNFVFYNRESHFYKFDLKQKKEEKVFDSKGYYNYDGGYCTNEENSAFLFSDGRSFSMKDISGVRNPQFIKLKTENNHHIFYIRDGIDFSHHLYVFGSKVSYLGKVSPEAKSFVSTSKDTAYLIQYENNNELRVFNIQNEEVVHTTNPSVNPYFIGFTLLGGRNNVFFSKPIIVDKTLYLLGSKGYFNFMSPLIEPKDFYLFSVDLQTKVEKEYSAASLIPESRLRNLLVGYGDAVIYPNDSDLNYFFGGNRFQFKSGSFNKFPLEEIEKGKLFPIPNGFISFTQNEVTFWNEEKIKTDIEIFPQLKRRVSGFHSFKKGQEFLWITHVTENGLAISKWDGLKLFQITDSIKVNYTGRTIIKESENRIDNKSLVLIGSENYFSTYIYDYESESLQLLGETNSTNLYEPIPTFNYTVSGDGSYLFKLYGAWHYRVNDNSIDSEQAGGFTSNGFILIKNSKLLLKYFADNRELVLSESFIEGKKSGDNYFFVDSDGYHVLDKNNTLVTIEPFPYSGLSPQLNVVSEKYLVCRVNNKMYLTNLQTGISEQVPLPFESLSGYKYYQQGNRIIGISQDNFSVYSYDTETRLLKTIKQFRKNMNESLTGTKTLFYVTDGRVEVWTMKNEGLEKIFEYNGKGIVGPYDKVKFINSENGYVYWNPTRNLLKEVPENDFQSYQWLDSLGSMQIFLNNNELLAFDEDAATWSLLLSIPDEEQLQSRIKVSKSLYFTIGSSQIWQTNGTALGTNRLVEGLSGLNYTSPFEEYLNKIYFVDTFGHNQLWRIMHKDSPIVLSNENPTINFSFYPNPTSDFLNISSTAESSEKYRISVFSTEGKRLNEYESSLPKQVNLTHLKQGVYLINVVKQGVNATFRMIKN